jgi:XTP/dITP diphosphohydrolase
MNMPPDPPSSEATFALDTILLTLRHQGLILATGNPHKLAELSAILAPAGLRVRGLLELRDPRGQPIITREPAETGTTFEANASIKALDYARQTGGICLADDSGLEVDALNGAPGVISSHYASDGRELGLSRDERDAANNCRLLAELRDLPDAERSARFVCVMAIASPNSLILTVRGTLEGRIGQHGPPPHGVPRGTHGFGYDPLFLIAPDFTRTGAELEPAEKNTLSHRAKAAEALLRALRPSP